MSSFFYHSAQTLLNQYADRFPLLKITQLLDWQAIEHTLASKKVAYLRDHGGRPAYPLLPMFRAVLLGQWHSLSDSELENSLKPLQNPKAFKLFWGFQQKWHYLPKFYPFTPIKQPISGCLPPFQAAIGAISLSLLAAFNKFKHITFNTICPLTFPKPK